MILCAGLGERLRPITTNIAKPAVPFLNVPMLGYPLFWLEQLGLDRLVINTHYLPETIIAAANRLCDWDYRVEFTTESPEILGSGGAIWNARDHFYSEKNFVVANGDSVFFLNRTNALNDMFAFHLETRALATLLVCNYPGVGEKFPGVWVNKNCDVKTFGKTPLADKQQCYHYAGVIFFNRDILDVLPKGSSNILYDVLVPQIAKGERVNVWIEEMKWYETGRPKDYLSASYECLESLFTNEGVKWHIVDILDRFEPGWRNSLEGFVAAKEKPDFLFKTAETTRVLIGHGVRSKTLVTFEGRSVLGENLDLTGRGATEGVYLSEIKMWIR